MRELAMRRSKEKIRKRVFTRHGTHCILDFGCPRF
jgi:hypothetical protein